MESVQELLTDAMYSYEWINDHKDEVNYCKESLEIEDLDDYDKCYCKVVISEYDKELNIIKNNIDKIKEHIKNGYRLTEEEQNKYDLILNSVQL